jgi:TPR repeat protein
MTDVATISAALTSLKSAMEIAKVLRDSDLSLERAELKLKLAELVGTLAEAKIELAEIQETLAERDARIQQLEEAFEVKDTLIRHHDAYYFRDDNGEPIGEPCCKACDSSWLIGCVNLGLKYVRGDGVSQDFTPAAALFQRACDGGEARGCFNLGIMYQRGDGVPQDSTRSAALYQKACEGGHEEACKLTRR